ncbi:hypothetical protein [Mycobacterium camsae]|uniref:hypothetical protein n=1 Tax=Mycobacterium gordonae TaxID=1778 RepID=UPI00197ED1FA|nr:hypothetical protein [Mycobacterium gordonae]
MTITPEYIDSAYAYVPIPAGAVADEWAENGQRAGYSRSLTWRTYEGPAGVCVLIDGRQQTDGTFTRHISLWGVADGAPLTGEQALETAKLLVRAADELGRLQ